MKEEASKIFQFLVANPGFRDWVLQPNSENNYFWKKWMAQHQDNLSEVQQAKEFILRLRFQQQQLTSKELDEILDNVIGQEQANGQPVVQKRKGNPFYLSQWQGIAAVLFLSLLAAFLIKGYDADLEPKPEALEWVTLENPKGRKSQVTLPDGSMVNLNYESRLKFPKAFKGGSRRVELKGEAFFDVVPNDTLPFVVSAGGVETAVLGTSFNIRSFEGEEETQISLVTGRIKVKKTGEETAKDIFLDQGEQVRINRMSGQMLKETFDIDIVTAWKEGIILFKDADLEEFVDQLGKWYGVDFQIYGTPSKKWKVNGRYQNEKLDDILTGLKFVYGLDYKIQGRNVILRFE